MAKKLDPKKVDRINKANEATLEAGKQQRERLVIDFDEFLDDYRSDEENFHQITFEGKTYNIPKEPTAEIFTFMLRKLNDGNLSDEDGIKILLMAIGDEFEQALSESEAPLSLVFDKILNPLLKGWGFGDPQHVEGNE